MALPAHAGELCFDPEVFLSEEFSVDEFVAHCRHQVSVDHLRNDLLSYYQSLKAAMVELINKDYADFVDLSSNLVCSSSLLLPSLQSSHPVGRDGSTD